MTRAKQQAFDHLSPEERAVVGEPQDYDWENAVDLPARQRPAATQFSLRVEESLLHQLQAIARERGVTVSEVAREALGQFVESGGRTPQPTFQISFPGGVGLLLHVETGRSEPPATRPASKVLELPEFVRASETS